MAAHRLIDTLFALSRSWLVIAALVVTPAAGMAQSPSADTIVPTLPPANPLPAEGATAGITKFTFLAYGDTRGRHDGTQLQAEHMLVVESMLRTIKSAAATSDPIRFVLQSGDAVVNGAIARQLSVSYIPLINRLTQEGGVPYFLSVGNHDLGNATSLVDTTRVKGMRNFVTTNARLIPAEGSPRRLTGYPTYAFGFGNTFFIAFDSNIPDDTIQFAWVKGQLEGLDRRRYPNVAVFYHHPAFSSGPHGGPIIERQAATIRAKWHPLFRAHHVALLLTGHEHLFEHWVERWTDASGPHRMDQIVSGGGGAPLYGYIGEPDLRAYTAAGAAQKLAVQHLVRPAVEPGANPYHYLIVRVDGSKVSIEVVGVDFGRGFAPYRSSGVTMSDGAP